MQDAIRNIYNFTENILNNPDRESDSQRQLAIELALAIPPGLNDEDE